ncbi:MAG: helix-turn-helix domain-containing protein [Niabella sp.]|nr:helix-turn-helix domain-containing protein [Niabella sp.]
MLHLVSTGSSPIDYFIRLKLQYACRLLKQSDLKIGEISVEPGYDDVFYFSRLFKKNNRKLPVGISQPGRVNTRSVILYQRGPQQLQQHFL